MNKKIILDVTCGSRSIWFQKKEPHTIYCDKRNENFVGEFGNDRKKDGSITHRELHINPDIEADFTNLPFDNNSFNLIVFDPPHIRGLKDNSWTRKEYGTLDDNWENLIHDGFSECMRVLKPNGVLVFKWSETDIGTRELIKAIGTEPLFGHRSGKKMNTHWLCYMKFEDIEADKCE